MMKLFVKSNETCREVDLFPDVVNNKKCNSVNFVWNTILDTIRGRE